VVDGVVGGALALASSSDAPYPVDVRATVGATRARIQGFLLDPLRLGGEDLNFELQGADMAQLFPILGVPLPPTPPYKLTGHLEHTGDKWTFRRFAGRVGKSDLSGDFTLDHGAKPQRITASLVSKNLEMSDLGGLIGADRGAKASPKPPPPGRVLPREPFSLEKLRVADMDVKFRGTKVVTEKLPLENMTASLKLRNGVLSLEPLNFGVAGGTLVSKIRMDARQPVIQTQADIAVKQLRLEKLLPEFKLTQANAGLLTGRAKLDTTGNSVASMLGGASGDAALIMEGGSVSELLVRLSNLDVANGLALYLTGDRQVPVRCMVTQLKGTNGVFRADPVVLDTGKAVITGNGNLDFAQELLDLRLVSRSKGFSLAALRGPIIVSGSFASPSVRPDMRRVVGRGAVATALGVATGGLGLVLPLLDFGGAKDSDCAALIREAGGEAVAG
jgi:AsmA family protein